MSRIHGAEFIGDEKIGTDSSSVVVKLVSGYTATVVDSRPCSPFSGKIQDGKG